jgi:hypothetical protein
MQARTVKFVDNANPAAGFDWTITVPTGELWRILAVSCFLQASATVANREAVLNVDEGGAIVTINVPSGTNHIASEGRIYSWISGAAYRGAGATSPNIVVGIGDSVFVSGGGRIRVITANIQVGDDWGPARAWVEVWS